MGFFLRTLIVGLAAFPGILHAETATNGCVSGNSSVAAGKIEQFKTSPSDLIGDLSLGTGAASSRIRNAVASDPTLLPRLTDTMKAAVGDEAVAWGLGLGSAAQICVKAHPDVAQQIQQSVERASNAALYRAFAGIIGDVAVLALSNQPDSPLDMPATPGSGMHRPVTPETFGFRPETSESRPMNFLSSSIGRGNSSSTTASSVAAAPALLSVSGTR